MTIQATTPVLPTNSEIRSFFEAHNTFEPGSVIATAELIITTLCNQQFQGFYRLEFKEYDDAGYRFASVVCQERVPDESLTQSYANVLRRVDEASGKIQMRLVSPLGQQSIWSLASVNVLRGSINAAIPQEQGFLPSTLRQICKEYIDLGDYVPRPTCTIQHIPRWAYFSEPPPWIVECLESSKAPRVLQQGDAEEYHSKPIHVDCSHPLQVNPRRLCTLL